MKYLLLSVSFLSISLCGLSNIKLPRLISNGMVLQRDVNLKIWGWADPGEKVAIRFKSMMLSGTTNEKGEWMITLPAQKAGGPYSLAIKGNNEIILTDILIGNVWLCGGQSNMELTMDRVRYKYPEEIAGANNSDIRQFTVPDRFNFKAPQSDVESGTWVKANKEHIKEFSAVAYFFAKDIYAKYKIPIGLINSALGGSPAESWISESAIQKFPSHYQEAQKFKSDSLISEIENRDRNNGNNWFRKLNESDEGLKQNWKASGLDDSTWIQMNIPGYWADTETGMVNGVLWFRKEIDVPAAVLNYPAKLELGRIVDADSVFINEQFVGTTGYQYPPRRYELKTGILKAGKNIITIRIVNNGGRGGFVKDKRYELTTMKDTIRLDGPWKYKVGAKMPPSPGGVTIRWKPVGLFNAMIAPLINYQIKGTIWYQGEANTSRHAEYRDLMETLILDWRKQWNQPSLPFLFVQLANFMEPRDNPQESGWAALRQQQLNTLSVPNTGMAVAIDAGEWNDIHPENKKDVGRRLALEARRVAYKEKNIVSAGPLYRSMKVVDNTIVLDFTNKGSGLTTKNNEAAKGFAIAGADGKYVWAQARIENNKIIVWSETVSNPVSVRYAWADNPVQANLYNKEGLPASPFTTVK